MNSIQYVAFLRGINVGGNKKVDMQELKKMFELAEYRNVKTLLNSGNVIFESDGKNKKYLAENIERKIEEKFGFHSDVILFSIPEIQKLVDLNPFKNITVTPDVRLYVTFTSDKPLSNLSIPYESPEKDFKILAVEGNAIISVLTLSETRKTPEAMMMLEKEFGRKITTRNWNTIIKILKK